MAVPPIPINLAVIFDMDGVLIDSFHAHYESWRRMAARAGLNLTLQQFSDSFGRTSREIIAALWVANSFDDARLRAMDDEKEANFREIISADFPAMPGAIELIDSLYQSGTRLAIGSSGPSANIDLALDTLGVRDRFNAIVTGADVARGKPDPQVFLLAAERLGVAPAACIVIEDAPAGIEAATRAGMAAIALRSTGRERADFSNAELVVNSLSELSHQTIWKLIEYNPRP